MHSPESRASPQVSASEIKVDHALVRAMVAAMLA
jgi:hypothetical protein